MKILVLFSGGLDSRLAAKLMQEQAQVELINFILPFGQGCCNKHCSLNFSQKENIKLKIVDCTKGKLLQEYINMIKKPKHGRGTCLNPCIDCRIFILKKAKKYADKNKIEVIATGEVLGERPMSQHSKALKIVEEESGLKGRLLRPLSAKLLEETRAEKSGLIDRSKLLDIQGRGRKSQIELAEKYKIQYPTPGGGCLLCDPEFCKKLKPLLNKEITELDLELLKFGRHFPGIILGRNEQENIKLEEIKNKFGGILIIPEEPGPSALIRDKKYLKQGKELIRKYSKNKVYDFKIESKH